jgi:hypothetical protein
MVVFPAVTHELPVGSATYVHTNWQFIPPERQKISHPPGKVLRRVLPPKTIRAKTADFPWFSELLYRWHDVGKAIAKQSFDGAMPEQKSRFRPGTDAGARLAPPRTLPVLNLN